MLTQASLVSWSVPAAIRLLATICWRRIFAVALLLVLFVASPYSLAFCSCWGGVGRGSERLAPGDLARPQKMTVSGPGRRPGTDKPDGGFTMQKEPFHKHQKNNYVPSFPPCPWTNANRQYPRSTFVAAHGNGGGGRRTFAETVWECLPCPHGTSGGAKFPSKDRDLPYWASVLVKSRFVRQNCAGFGTSQGPQPKRRQFGSRMRAGQTFPLCPGTFSLLLTILIP